ncbi:MAG: phosphoribosylformylglycinamidine cyclo-ligase [Candidatus Marinimicrobia bacterium]|jgi:phosphoribosylformylglycinamidine cyclo-ligase|nr:phosphoribosylformylglycinamidine cyclo-ligase [Candidatus Neomarinimicrobiota bacterium]MBT5720559.1 phosphoribosylformylglycinamidine cyclo-ligase [Candidatus Neomarinimicrobiota bacterium]MBT6517516.1 phosphoribosylformylglycinamidine cyclo-ligase [Candidatus Neomarinimicrobiota bacterium]MBT6981227.1 phosphoribosylformylglycinamidine cyclo-ligase [Candidatus Neomarinimicrobiota bacterium]MBT7119878.1 phosphoribosylformylglycinamidine cyclo-ligase [Candidatus Neomarinimicrobiota bacterium
MGKIDYKSAGVNIDAGNEAVNRIKDGVKSTFTSNVLTGLGSFGSLYDLKPILDNYDNPVMVQSIDGVGTKTIIARKLGKFDTIGIDLLSAAANDILVMGARPLTFLDYIANDKLNPETVEEIVSGMVKACKSTGVSLVGGETAEMPDTYLPGEHDLVGIITGVVEKEKIITGENIKPGDVLLGLPSNGLHTNGYSFARKLYFEIGGYDVNDTIPELEKSIGLTLLEPHINYTNHVFATLDAGIDVKGIAHITGGGLVENIPRILPDGCGVEIQKGSWPNIPVFDVMQSIGDVDENEMYRAFNMGIGMTFIVSPDDIGAVTDVLKDLTDVYEIGSVVNAENAVLLK